MYRVVLLAFAYALVGCGDGGDSNAGGSAGAGGSGDPGEVSYPLLDCDPLVPDFCGYPFPSNVYSIDDATTPTGRRVNLGPNLVRGTPDQWNEGDGFSTGSPILTFFENVSDTGLPSPDDIPASMDAASPTLLINAQTGLRVPHFAVVDVRATDETRSILIRPVVRLDDATRYIVALRGLVDRDGAAIMPSPVFAALRDRTTSADPSVAARATLYEDIFARLETANVDRGTLQIAWDFTTASDTNNTERLLHMRDESLGMVGAMGPEYTITSVENDYNTENIAYRIFGTMSVPLYMNTPEPGAVMLFGDDGLPDINAAMPWADIPFEILIPQSALTQPAALLQYGHGLFGEMDQIQSGHFQSFINEYNYIFFATDLIGMSDSDFTAVLLALSTGDLKDVRTIFDRLHQGYVNYLLLMRMMKGRFASDLVNAAVANGLPEDVMVDPTNAYYYGISQGGIQGSVYMALSTDVERGALGVMGQPYSLLLFRSDNFNIFLDLIKVPFPDPREQQLVVALMQPLWDRVEPNGYSHHVTANPLPGTNAKQVLMRAAISDHQVTTLGAHIMARTMDAVHMESGLRDIWDLEKVQSVTDGRSFYTEYEFGNTPEPLCNLPPSFCRDPHEFVRRTDAARMQLNEFLRNGTGTNHCTDGVCSFEMAECAPEETAAAVLMMCTL